MEISGVSHLPLRPLLALSKPLLGRKTLPIISTKTHRRLNSSGVDTGRIIDIIFHANGIVNVLVHELYTPVFTNIMNIVKVNIPPISPIHCLFDPNEVRTNNAADLSANQCKRTLLCLRNTCPHQVKAVGHSKINLGYISEKDL
ncbi:uncharacterized protein EV154DRAFT_487717 [Mucor mucedo]|uniref:uncharacterized protein n=1 Tax=Mucor mucedo TaxID=29922 RepID=UPI00221FDDFD|nr:uncharacterized protein EV154DRAFT_487717 [Mucor mucedo]KAI7871101.1 hypothetical protein EV154DRAFT_487717 [Mucor mucedo]